MKWYSATGEVRGACGHAHKTAKTALACATKDARACKALPGGCYSDRSVRAYETPKQARMGDIRRGVAIADANRVENG